MYLHSPSEQQTFWDTTTGFPRKDVSETCAEIPCLLRITTQIWVVLLIRWSKFPTIRSTTQIWVVARHEYGIFVLVSQTSFPGETSGDVAKCRLFSQAYSYGREEMISHISTGGGAFLGLVEGNYLWCSTKRNIRHKPISAWCRSMAQWLGTQVSARLAHAHKIYYSIWPCSP